MAQRNWFEISNEGWRRLNAGRTLGSLIKEAVQNAFDTALRRVSVVIDADGICIEDDGQDGIVDERLVYTVFLTDKADSPLLRGRKGRGLKELISACDSAVVETIGRTIVFDHSGRQAHDNQRQRGTRLKLQRHNRPRDIREACEHLKMVIPPQTVTFAVNGETVRAPRCFATVRDCVLDTVVLRHGIEHTIERETELTLYQPRGANERPHIFEMGLPVQPFRLPWHVDVAQRIPLADGRDRLDDIYRLTVIGHVLEELVDRLPEEHLRDDWVTEVLTWCELSDQTLRTFARRVFPTGSVLGASRRANDQARQRGRHVIDAEAMPRGVRESLSRVLETSDTFINRQLRAQETVRSTLEAHEQHAVDIFQYLAKEILGRQVSVHLVDKPPAVDGHVEDGSFDGHNLVLKLNVRGSVDLRSPLSPASLAVLFHELAHAEAPEHDGRFIRELERVAARGAALLARQGARLLAGR